MTPRTFSIARLMLAITLLCVVIGLAVGGSEEVQAFLLIFLLFLPTGIVCLTLVSFSRKRKTVLISSILGACLSSLFAPPVIGMGGGPRNVLEAVLHVALPFASVLPFGALILGGAALLDDLWPPRATAEDDRLDQQNEIHRLLRQ